MINMNCAMKRYLSVVPSLRFPHTVYNTIQYSFNKKSWQNATRDKT